MSNNFINLTNISYNLPNGDSLFMNLSYNFLDSQKIAIVGDNGVGKTTLLNIIIGNLEQTSGSVRRHASINYLIQNIDSIKGTIKDVICDDYTDNWEIKQRILNMISFLDSDRYSNRYNDDFLLLSGGEKQKILIAKTFLSNSDILFFDEPTNNLDRESKRDFFYILERYKNGIVVISHDRTFVDNLNITKELYL
jgi:ATPase subunit of ABC transporter with duplicated ATPase domains